MYSICSVDLRNIFVEIMLLVYLENRVSLPSELASNEILELGLDSPRMISIPGNEQKDSEPSRCRVHEPGCLTLGTRGFLD